MDIANEPGTRVWGYAELVTEAIVVNSPLGQYNASLVNQGHIVMIFSPVNATENLRKQHPPLSWVRVVASLPSTLAL